MLEVKAGSTLMMGIPNQHQLKFKSIKDAKSLLETTKKRFGGNDATKKTQRNLLNQQHENFTASRYKSLDQTFNRLQKLVSQLKILKESISQEDVNKKFLRSLPSEWNMHVVVWRNKPNLDSMSMDDLYNNLKVNAANSTNIDKLSDAIIEEVPKVVKKDNFVQIIEVRKSNDEDESVPQPKIEKKIVKPSVAKVEFVKPKQQSQNARKNVKNVKKSRQSTNSK
nr:ribonuclease H-like domain-containing protein [Tanacetum cinerariifolium]